MNQSPNDHWELGIATDMRGIQSDSPNMITLILEIFLLEFYLNNVL